MSTWHPTPRTYSGNHILARSSRRSIHRANKHSRLPMHMIGFGFDADMEFLENIARKSAGGCAVNVIGNANYC